MAEFRDTYTAAWALKINGQDLPDELRDLVRQVRVEQTVDGADQLSVAVTTWDTVAGRWAFLEDNVLAPGNVVDVLTGYGTDLRHLQRFTMLASEASYPAGDTPTATMVGFSAEHRLVRHTAARTFKGPISDSEVARTIAQEHRLDASGVVDLPVRDGARVKPKGTTDLAFLQELARFNQLGPPRVQYDPERDAEVLIFRPTDLRQQEDQLVFSYRPLEGEAVGNLHTFSPDLDLSDVPTGVVVTGWDPDKGEIVEVHLSVLQGTQERVIYRGGTPDELQDLADGTAVRVTVTQEGKASGEDTPENVATEQVTTTEQALDYARRWVAQRRQAYMTARATAAGDPRVRLGDVHTFQGMAAIHSGLWEVQAATHVIADGYGMDLDLTRVLQDSPAPTEV